jgi:nucleoid DNA-binding protein
MTKQELIERVASTPGLPPDLTKKMVGTLVDAVFAELGDYFVKAKVNRRQTPRFTYPGFGTFTKKRKNGRTGRNPRTGDPIAIPPSVTVTFVPGQGLKSVLNRSLLKSSQG